MLKNILMHHEIGDKPMKCLLTINLMMSSGMPVLEGCRFIRQLTALKSRGLDLMGSVIHVHYGECTIKYIWRKGTRDFLICAPVQCMQTI